jgi:hypothetical protein
MPPHLYHYSAEPFMFDPTRTYRQDPSAKDQVFKPRGLWLSVEPDDDPDERTWRTWCVAEDFHLEALVHRTEITLALGADILWLRTAADIRRFDQTYRRRLWDAVDAIDWPTVVTQTQGLIIAPYQWSVRLDLLWYYGWDCASGCIWDAGAVRIVAPCDVS